MRDKYKTRTIILIGEMQRNTAISVIQNAPIDPIAPLEVVIREQVKARGLDANGYYWLRIGEIAEQGWFNGKRYSKEVWHDYAKKHIMNEEIVTKDGEIRSKWEETPDGGMSVISTTLLDKRCFAEYVTAVEAFGCELGVMFSEKA
jgi:hypothetical protein